MVFNSSTTYGLLFGLSIVLAITIIDALYISLSGLGVAAIINKERIKYVIKILGCVILVIFGANTIAGVFEFKLLPSISLFNNVNSQNTFVQGLLLTASNPLTIIFWSGVFSTQVIENKLNKRHLLFFGIGCILSTIVFLSAIAFCGSILSGFLPNIMIQILNVVVGLIIIFFGIKLLFK
jgi:threonine/homoserine/homoserine lactone efflux protein